MVWPPVVGIVLALMARAHSGGRLAWVALALNAGALIFVTVPSLVDRLIHL